MPNFATKMKSAFALTVAILATSLAASAASLEVEKLETLDFDLPKAIRLRAEMAALQRPEFVEDSEAAGLNAVAAADYRVNPARWAHVYRASDGQVFLVDNLHMALWVRVDDKWTCVLPHVRVEKTFGGAPPRLPFRYLGSGMFAVSETVPGRVEEISEEGFPQARAVTFLIDSRNSSIKERSKNFVYDHSPPVKIPKNWFKKHELEDPASVADP